jgi:hypothetical protein
MAVRTIAGFFGNERQQSTGAVSFAECNSLQSVRFSDGDPKILIRISIAAMPGEQAKSV